MKTPILDALNDYRDKKPFRYHTPGHKAEEEFCRLFPMGDCDITELFFSDNLHHPSGILKEAEELAAKAYNCDKVFFVTSGTTLSVQIMVYAASKRGSRILIERSSHISVYNACELFSVTPVFLDKNERNLDSIAKILDGDEKISAVLLTTPDYFGNCLELNGIAEEVEKRDKLLLCDSAHGSHLGFTTLLPPSPAPLCDMTALSPHKTLPALTQGSYLCVNGQANIELAQKGFSLLHTTSPSYPVMASLDYARAFMEKHGGQALNRLKVFTDSLKQELNNTPIKIVENEDFTKVVADISLLQITESELYEFLKEQNVYPEITDTELLLFILTVNDTEKSLQKLRETLLFLTQKFPQKTRLQTEISLPVPTMVTDYLTAVSGEYEKVVLENSLNRVLTQNIGLYPPGTPTAVAGERMSKELLQFLLIKKNRLIGLDKGSIKVLK